MKPHKSQMALQNYLDGLLQEVPEAPPEPRPVLFDEPPAGPLILPTLTTPLPVDIVQVAEPEPVPEPAEPVVEVPGRPGWSEQALECLLFDVAGLTLAVPLMCLGSIYPLAGDEITPIFAQPDWFIGLMPTPLGNLKVLDTARWVMPERYSADLREQFRYVISIDGYGWGLAVNTVRDSVLLQPDDIKWRARRADREWLAGTVIEHMCALLDVGALANMIERRETAAGSGSSCAVNRR